MMLLHLDINLWIFTVRICVLTHIGYSSSQVQLTCRCVYGLWTVLLHDRDNRQPTEHLQSQLPEQILQQLRLYQRHYRRHWSPNQTGVLSFSVGRWVWLRLSRGSFSFYKVQTIITGLGIITGLNASFCYSCNKIYSLLKCKNFRSETATMLAPRLLGNIATSPLPEQSRVQETRCTSTSTATVPLPTLGSTLPSQLTVSRTI